MSDIPNHECEYRKDGVCPVCYRIAELEALNASYNCDRERHHRLIDKLQAKLDAAKDIARSAYVGEGGSISAFEYAWKSAIRSI